MKIRTGAVLAAAAVAVAFPRHLVAQLHQAGYGTPTGAAWPVLIVASAAAWAALEALTMFYLWNAYGQSRRRHLLWLMGAILGAIALTNAPSLVADSAGLTLTGLVGIASAAHWLWAVASIASTLLVVIAAGAADAATTEAGTAALIDALDAQRQPQAIAAQQVTVNVSRESPPDAMAGPPRRETAPLRISGHKKPSAATESAVSAAIQAGMTTSPAIAAEIGKSSALVKQTAAWRKFREAAK
jgi:hypothetical protein